MRIDYLAFSPISAVVGGMMIGAACALLILVNGRIAGISGIVEGVLERFAKSGRSKQNDTAWRVAFLTGLIAAPWLYRLSGQSPLIVITSSPTAIIVAGLLVGVGTRYASGCTSGHGVCGLARGSKRSFIATLTFMVAGFATVLVVRHLIGV